MEKKSKRYYAVLSGHKTGIFETWFGAGGAKAQIDGFSNAKYKGFGSYDEAKNWLKQPKSKGKRAYAEASTLKSVTPEPGLKEVILYTDGGCLNNPGPGGYGTVMLFRGRRKELSGGYRKTTNNRMELMACIVGLSELKTRCRVFLHSDSKYVINGIEKGWAKKWRRSGWMRNKVDPAENYDLWEVLLDLCDKHEVLFKWVKGHSGVPENERCDELAGKESSKKGLPQDVAYEGGKTTIL